VLSRRLQRGAAAALTAIAAAVLIFFIGLPLLSIFLRVPLSTLVHQLHSQVARDALAVSLKTSLTSLAFIVVVGTPVAHLIATKRFPGRNVLATFLELPLVLPPVVAGIALFAAFGRLGLLGHQLYALHIHIPFTWVAVVMAQSFVSMPFYVRQATAGFASVDRQLVGASRTLGAGPARSFFRIEAPLSSRSLSAGATLAWARALGEFGATALFAGSLPGITQTLPLAVYAEFSALNFNATLAMSALLVAVSFAILLVVRIAFNWRVA